ncbi:hypothetical protein H2198_001825 [Neophaeococcomyces mojaviensis]|uniref:Uncharacterized protein n=1 Tax=Neophaeococcomyces mojaviensis TaxID=3383035 RepID=A0ACC3AGC6_9EURO|nr:hypothetical protein H2198_001825 [Knufia sp. JES_112]
MFKKKPQIKNLSSLKSSERRKLADQVRKDYSIPEPQPDAPSHDQEGQPATQPQQTLTSIRNALLPDPTSAAKFTTTYGRNFTPVSGTIYVGAHPGQEERILWFQIGKDDRLIPTVYTLWQNPGLTPLLYVGDIVVGKLKGGADLFAPGLIEPHRGFDERAKKGSVIAVAGHKSDTVPRWVGTSSVDISALGDNPTGTAAEGLHWEGDELWAWSALNKGGMAAPESIDGWLGIMSGLEEEVEDLDIDDDGEGEQEGGGVALEHSTSDLKAANGNTAHDNDKQEEEEDVPTTKEVDDAFIEAFLYAVHNAKKTNPAEPHGFDLPIQPSYLISNMIQPHLRHQSPHYNIKKTSWKNAKKFIKHLDKAVLVKSKDRNGGETVILDIDFNDQKIKNFQPYPLPKPKVAETTEDGGGGSKAQDPGTDQSLGQKLTLQVVYRASSKLVPDLLSSKTQFYTSQQITTALKQYIEDNPDLVNESKKRYIKLNPFIANNILGSNSSTDDSKALAAGEIDRGTLNRRILEDDHLCIPHHILLRNEQTLESDSSLKPKAGPPPKVTLTIEKRGGNKVVTAIAGLEAFFINPQLIRPELQKKCAGSASVGQLVGGKPGMLEVQVQGDQRAVIEKEILGKRGVKPEWIEVVDKTKKKGKK